MSERGRAIEARRWTRSTLLGKRGRSPAIPHCKLVLSSVPVIRLLALAALAAGLFGVFRFAMALRYAMRERESARRAEEARGRRVIAEVPLSEDEVVFLTEDDRVFAWGAREVAKAEIVGARLLVNGAVLQEFAARPGLLPPPQAPAEYEGRERWEVAVFLEGGSETRIPCGTLREGVSREIAGRAFAAVRAAAGQASGSLHWSSGRPSSG
jgi:hypothetical protein